MHPSTYREMEKFSKSLPASKLLIADVGSADINGTYKPIFQRSEWRYTGLDIEAGRNVDVVLHSKYDWKNVPDGAFDVVVSGQTLEHTEYPWLFVKELARIAKKGALLCVIAPCEWEYHAFPIDCWRIFPDGMKAVLQYNGLQVLETYISQNSTDPRWKSDTVGIALKPL
jgi:SAM-dependent methyltransferase